MERLDFDPVTGVSTYFEFTNDGKLNVRYEQDVEPVLDLCKALANEGIPDEKWRKDGISVYAIIPPVIQAAMYKRGIDFMDPNDIGRVVQEMNTTYSAFKTTTKHHEVR